ncbi:brefeldin A-inhibited guanine nucleotide-exchange protein 3 isoform X2 [Procambarus clarkii]|uniref:brefeldin A-inhibited guanine nucleotide-exchange protein 3 isoform X2 n=1 Tax=Procambarus clarkii TaxID=6728 RepID=UPI001E670607|nr:brefeldin A-inhibited guanine nucleotide-exchange protein 3-like isoform X2 [Procambarus clarkii]
MSAHALVPVAIMEEVLDQLLRETSTGKHAQIHQACTEARDFLENQAGLLRSPPHELRALCLQALQLALETRQSKLVSLAVSGFFKLLRDTQFHSGYEEDDETVWLPCQLLGAIQSLPLHLEDTQVELLKVLLNMSCVPGITVSGQVVTQVVGVCGLAYGRGGAALRTAAQSAASQAIAHLVKQLKEESEEQEKIVINKSRNESHNINDERTDDDDSDYIAPAYDEIVPVINFIADKLIEANKHQDDKKGPEVPALFLLECTNTLLFQLSHPENLAHLLKPSESVSSSALPSPAYCSTLLVGALWQRLCPALVALLGSPVSQRLARASGRAEGQMGRGSGCLAHPGPLFNNQQARAIYNVACGLVVTMGSVGEMRPVLESLFYRMLLYPPPQCRQDALKAITELISSPVKLVQLSGPILYPDPRNPHQNDLALFRLVMDSLAECGNCSDVEVQRVLVECVSTLLSSLEKLSLGSALSQQHVEVINATYARLQDGDYSGPLTYENKSKLPKYEISESVKHVSDSAASDTLSQKIDDLDEEEEVEKAKTEREEKEGKEDEEDSDKRECQGEGEADSDHQSQEFGKSKSGRNKDGNVSGDKGADSDASGDTEGPEDESDIGEEQFELEEAEHQQQCEEQEALRLHRLNETLQSTSNLRHVIDDEAERECENAQHFTCTLCALLPSLLAIRSTIEVDQAILEFSAKYCEGVFSATNQEDSHQVIINADGIYLATYSVLSLNLQLIRGGHYCDPNLPLPMNQEQFVDLVHGSGVLVYLSSAWLGEVYRQVTKDSFLQRAGYTPHSPHNCALINLLTDLEHGMRWSLKHDFDLDGLGSTEQKSQMLSDHRRLEKAASNVTSSPELLAGMKLCRRIVTCGWESLLGVLGAVLNGAGGSGGLAGPLRLLLGTEGAREESRKSQELLARCLNALQSSARLANVLGLQNRCGVVFSLLASACLPNNDCNAVSTPKRHHLRSPAISKKVQRLHTAHLLSVHVIMSSGLELGSHAPECWTHIFKCCIYLAELERTFFSHNSGYQSFPTRLAPPPLNSEKSKSESPDDLFNDDPYRFVVPVAPLAPSTSVEELIRESQSDTNSSGFLSPQDTGKAICALTQLVDRLFDDASTKLNMASLVSFLAELCAASQAQLFSRMSPHTPHKGLIKWPRKTNTSSGTDVARGKGGDILLLHRLAEVMLRAVNSGRPLLHIMRAWAVAGPHFMEAACHKDGSVSKKAVSSIHDIVNALLSNQTELPHFHFNEALFKPFENLLCLELCDLDIQDQIVSSICEFVESCTPEIRSGWRPLFGALRCVRPPSILPVSSGPTNTVGSTATTRESVGHLHVVRDVFEAFLATDNVLVFANAALDCILCLLKHVKGSGEEESCDETVVGWDELVSGDLCLDALRYLHRCAAILASMYEMPACPVFHAAHRITIHSPPQLVDPHLPNIDENLLWTLVTEITDMNPKEVSYAPLWPSHNCPKGIYLASMDRSSGILQVWYLLLEGLAGATMTCPRRYQPQVLDTLFSLLRSLPDCPGSTFGMYCVNHLLLPLMQGWLRRSNTYSSPTSWDFTASFKQYTGLTSDLVVEYIKKMSNKGVLSENQSARLMLQQCLLVLVECITHPTESTSRLGCACIRHVINSCGENLPPEYWNVVVCALHRGCQVALYPLYQLMNLFQPDSPNFYGDVGQVKVAARRDCTGKDSDRLRQLSHQVFLLDTQRSNVSANIDNPDAEDRSFIFLLYPEEQGPTYKMGTINPDTIEGEPVRVPFRTLVVGLLAHQILLQTLGTLLVRGSPHIIPSLANVLLQGLDFSQGDSEEGRVAESEGQVPGFLRFMTPEHVQVLLNALQVSYTAAVEFDRRPGLKFLIQKVAQAERAANLYKQAGASWTLRMVTLFDLTLAQVKHGLGLPEVKEVLEQDIKAKNTFKRELNELGKSADMDNDNEDVPDPTSIKCPRPKHLLKEDTMQYIQLLRDSFTELCDVYLDLVIDRDGHYSAVDRIDDQPIFFLTVQPDEFPTAHRKSLAQWTRSLEEFNEHFTKGKKMDLDVETEDKDPISGTMTIGASPSCATVPSDLSIREEVHEEKPFTFSDLARDYSSDSEDSELPEFAEGGDSGIASLAGAQQSIYRVATERDIATLMTDYRRRKNQHSLPSLHREKRTNPFLEKRPSRPAEPVPPEIEEQRTNSLMKDSEAHLKVWTEMVVTVFDLISQLSDSELGPLLPLLFPTIRSLTAHAHDPHLRQVVAELLTRVATLYGFSPAE